ncbi:MAG: hypothetical protein QXG02_03755, partial [Candidatus Anstonellales archaeon]
EFGYSDQIAVQLTDNLTDGFWNFLRFIYSPDGFDRLAECIKNGDEKGWEKYVEGMDFHGKTYLFDVAKGFYLTAEETMTTVYVYLYFNASGEKRNNILEEAKKAGIKFGDLALLIYKAAGQEGLKELIKHSKGIYSNLEISTGLGVLAYEGLIDADFYHSLVSEFGLVDLSSAENIKNILDRLEKFAEESAEFKEWLEENVNMQDLENAVKELDAKGLEKSSEETKRVVEEVIKALDKIIETTVNEDRRRVAEILKEMLEGMMGVEG